MDKFAFICILRHLVGVGRQFSVNTFGMGYQSRPGVGTHERAVTLNLHQHVEAEIGAAAGYLDRRIEKAGRLQYLILIQGEMPTCDQHRGRIGRGGQVLALEVDFARGHGHGRDCDGELQRHEEDVDGDGDIDLVLHFAKAEAMIACGDTEAFLTGETFAGESFTASDVVCTTGDCCRDDDDGEDDGEGGHEKELTGVAVKASLGLSPNPFNPATEIVFSLARPAAVTLTIHDLAGRRLITLLANVQRPAGEQSVRWDGRDATGRSLPSGVYVARLAFPEGMASRKLTLLK